MSETELRQESPAGERAELGTPPLPPSSGGWGSGPVIWRVVALGLALVFLYFVRGVLAPFIVAGMLSFLLAPVASAAERQLRVPRVVAVLATMLLVIVPIAVGVVLAAPMLIRESTDLIRRGPTLLTAVVAQMLGTRQVDIFGQLWTSEELTTQLTRAVVDWMGGSRAALRAATVSFEALVGGLVVLVTTFYLLLDPGQLASFGLSLFPPARRPRIRRITRQVNAQLRRYLVGLLFLVGLMTAVTWIGLTFVFHQPYSLAVAALTGFLEVIPLAGPIAAGAVAVIVALAHGGVPTAVGVIIMYTVLRQLEDQIVIPLVQRSAVQVPPIATIFAVVTGGALAGVIGMLLAVPVVVVLKVVRESLMEDERPVVELAEPLDGRPPGR